MNECDWIMSENDNNSNANKICTVLEARKWASNYLTTCKLENPIKESDFLLSYVLDVDRSQLLAYPERELPVPLAERFYRLIVSRGKGQPLAYLTNQKEFMSLNFKVTEDVLVPRPETEILVETALKIISRKHKLLNLDDSTECAKSFRILDLCTGTGNIGLSIGYYCRNELQIPFEIVLGDISPDALQVAEHNAFSLGLSCYCDFIQTDMFANISKNDKFDIITVNPPYVSSEEYCQLSREVKSEPKSALIAKEKGLFYYRFLAEQYRNYLNTKGSLIMEIGAEQQTDVERLFADSCEYIKTHRDLAGYPRVMVVQ